ACSIITCANLVFFAHFMRNLLFSSSLYLFYIFFFFFSSRRRHTRFSRDWSSDVCSSDLRPLVARRHPGRDRARDRAGGGALHPRTQHAALAVGLHAPQTAREARWPDACDVLLRRPLRADARPTQIGRASCRGGGEVPVGR